MGAQKSCLNLETEEAVLLCRVEERWDAVVAKIQFGLEPLCPALQRFLLFLGRLLEVAGETSGVDLILAAVGRAKLSDEKGLSELEAQSLTVLDQKWSNLVREVRAKTVSLIPGLKDFMRATGHYILCHAEPNISTSAEKHRRSIQDFYVSRGFRDVVVPPLNCTGEELNRWFSEGRNAIYEPSNKEVSAALIGLQLPFKSLVDDPSQIAWERVSEGRWLLVDAQEHCPRIGERSYEGFTFTLEEGQQIMTLRQYAIAWHLGSVDGEIMDLETDTLLSTRYGTEGVLHAYASLALANLRFSVGEWRNLGTKHPKMGIRIVTVIE